MDICAWHQSTECVRLQGSPPLARYEAPLSGALRWSRALFVRLKRAWGRLQRQEAAALQDSTGARVRR